MTSRIGRLCFRYRWLVLAGWLVLFAGGVLSAGRVLDGIGAVEQRYAPESVGNVVTVVTLLSLGLSVDYGLLLVARYREELVPAYRTAFAAGGKHPERSDRAAALSRAWGTAGRTVVFSALTIAAALSGLLLLRITSLQAMAAAGISVALVALVTALTFTAAMLAAVGRWVRPSRRALRRIASEENAESGFFARLARAIQRRPLVVLLGTTLALIAAGAPLLSAVVKLPGL